MKKSLFLLWLCGKQALAKAPQVNSLFPNDVIFLVIPKVRIPLKLDRVKKSHVMCQKSSPPPSLPQNNIDGKARGSNKNKLLQRKK